MKGINPLKTFNIWFVFKQAANYELVDTIDFEFKFDISDFKKLAKANLASGSFILLNEVGKKTLNEIKKSKLNKQYDACCLIHISHFEDVDDKMRVSVDCFKIRM